MNNVIAGKLLAILESDTWHEVEKQLALQRENIIAKGKKARNEGKQIAMWSELEGYDKAIMTIKAIANYREKTEQGYGEE